MNRKHVLTAGLAALLVTATSMPPATSDPAPPAAVARPCR